MFTLNAFEANVTSLKITVFKYVTSRQEGLTDVYVYLFFNYNWSNVWKFTKSLDYKLKTINKHFFANIVTPVLFYKKQYYTIFMFIFMLCFVFNYCLFIIFGSLNFGRHQMKKKTNPITETEASARNCISLSLTFEINLHKYFLNKSGSLRRNCKIR